MGGGGRPLNVYAIPTPADLAPGAYDVRLLVYDADTLDPLEPLDAGWQPGGAGSLGWHNYDWGSAMSELEKAPLPSPPQIGRGRISGCGDRPSSTGGGWEGVVVPPHPGHVLLAGVLYSVYTFTNAGRFHIIDEVSIYGVTESVARRGSVDTNAIAWTQWVNSPGEVLGAFGPDGDVYSKKGPGPAFAAWRAYGVTWAGRALGLKWGLLQGVLLWNGFLTALTAVLLWLTVLRLGYRDRTGMILGLLFGLGTIAWPYANHLFSANR